MITETMAVYPGIPRSRRGVKPRKKKKNKGHVEGGEKLTPVTGPMGVNPKMVGFPNKPMGKILVKMISTWGWRGGDWGNPPF